MIDTKLAYLADMPDLTIDEIRSLIKVIQQGPDEMSFDENVTLRRIIGKLQIALAETCLECGGADRLYHATFCSKWKSKLR